MSVCPKFLREWKSESEETQAHRPARLEEAAVISKRPDIRKKVEDREKKPRFFSDIHIFTHTHIHISSHIHIIHIIHTFYTYVHHTHTSHTHITHAIHTDTYMLHTNIN